jgi:hypothetical protein
MMRWVSLANDSNGIARERSNTRRSKIALTR